jgi:hypothetical protein
VCRSSSRSNHTLHTLRRVTRRAAATPTKNLTTDLPCPTQTCCDARCNTATLEKSYGVKGATIKGGPCGIIIIIIIIIISNTENNNTCLLHLRHRQAQHLHSHVILHHMRSTSSSYKTQSLEPGLQVWQLQAALRPTNTAASLRCNVLPHCPPVRICLAGLLCSPQNTLFSGNIQKVPTTTEVYHQLPLQLTYDKEHWHSATTSASPQTVTTRCSLTCVQSYSIVCTKANSTN